MKSTAFLAALVAILPAHVDAQAAQWGQCGGIGWCTSRLSSIPPAT